jgi:chromosome segregation protein
LQQAALGKQDKVVVEWLEKHNLHKQPRLAERIRVRDGWEEAVETVLGPYLEAVCIDKIKDIETYLNELQAGSLTLMAASGDGRTLASVGYLAEKVDTEFELPAVLRQVRTADTLATALAMLPRLAPTESVITRDGIWLGANWLRVTRSVREQGSVLAREQDIKTCKQQLQDQLERVQRLEQELETAKKQLVEHEQQREQLQSGLREENNRLADVRSRLHAIKVQLEQVQSQRSRLVAETAGINQQIEQDQHTLRTSQERMNSARAQAGSNTDKRNLLQSQRTELERDLQEARKLEQADREALHEIALAIESMRSTKTSTDQSLTRMKQQLLHLQTRRDELQAALSGDSAPIEVLQSELEELLQKKIQVDRQLGEARTQVEIAENEIRGLEQQRAALENKVQEMRALLEQTRLAAQEAKIRCQTLKEQLDESGFETEVLFREMPEAATIESWADEVQKMDQRIQRMGPINLAAIDEHREQQERKEYLDAQDADLTAALKTLEDAIAKIDRETRARFKEIFDKVSAHIRDMFPRLFGGGQAYLEMTGNDLLSTGVSIMARPPGKRISNIHLLSGGEKALTAVAMVFAIFQLNPAPFCMLDEVDAPLDEANVGRFCELVREMSSKVQFILITHNKTTMEMTQQLMGVTMREAGVSRIVAVDVDEAVKMATA